MDANTNIPKIRKIAFWITTTVIAIMYFVTGLGNILPFTHIAQDMARLGYPTYFLKIIGTWKILAATAIVIPRFDRVKEWVYAGMMFDLTGAALSRYFIGDPLPMVIIPLCLSILVTVNYVIRHALHNKVAGSTL
ncbi:DoxX family protein [Mucilaginibacter ginsenosidivorans]|uniref:DoxX family protein n=1 Tax=Mucilaginibacter ginsenosidivorans TaxID=398053 RepID=A0A5B8URF0_9SPHI|nr:DoxX family protein [Mucilaginibacter ginsenosidivorans]QEC61472.1 DoxX family protein [Mucilaginibacter ginsenosidivorans]